MALEPKTVYIPSADAPGKCFRVEYIKRTGNPGYFFAIEGEKAAGDGYITFTCEFLKARQVRKYLDGRATKPRLQALYAEIIQELRTRGYIAQRGQEVAA